MEGEKGKGKEVMLALSSAKDKWTRMSSEMWVSQPMTSVRSLASARLTFKCLSPAKRGSSAALGSMRLTILRGRVKRQALVRLCASGLRIDVCALKKRELAL